MQKAFSREMNITHADFFRLLPRVITRLTQSGMVSSILITTTTMALIEIENARLQITLQKMEKLRIGSLSMPLIHINFLYTGTCSELLEQFMNRFKVTFQKGGG